MFEVKLNKGFHWEKGISGNCTNGTPFLVDWSKRTRLAEQKSSRRESKFRSDGGCPDRAIRGLAGILPVRQVLPVLITVITLSLSLSVWPLFITYQVDNCYSNDCLICRHGKSLPDLAAAGLLQVVDEAPVASTRPDQSPIDHDRIHAQVTASGFPIQDAQDIPVANTHSFAASQCVEFPPCTPG